MRKENVTDQQVNDTLEKFKGITQIFSVLADENRQRIIAELGVKDELNVKELTDRIPLSRPAISHHLKNMKQAGLINNKKRGTENYYYLTIKDTIKDVRQLMDQIEAICHLV